jgi:CheY-like chemotaxis protein
VVTALSHQGYRVLHAASGDEAIAIAEADHGDIDLLLTDARMPGMSGIELARTLVGRRPGLPVLVMSGYSDETLSLGGQPIPLLSKPFTPRQLRQKVAEILGD